jgi:hypothetical protein
MGTEDISSSTHVQAIETASLFPLKFCCLFRSANVMTHFDAVEHPISIEH